MLWLDRDGFIPAKMQKGWFGYIFNSVLISGGRYIFEDISFLVCRHTDAV